MYYVSFVSIEINTDIYILRTTYQYIFERIIQISNTITLLKKGLFRIIIISNKTTTKNGLGMFLIN